MSKLLITSAVLLALIVFKFSYANRLNSKTTDFAKKVTQFKPSPDLLTDDKLTKILVNTANFSSVANFLEAFGFEDDPVDPLTGRRRAKQAKVSSLISQQAACEPELRTVHLDSSNRTDELFFPKCVRVPRCGGCCGLSDRVACVPIEVSQRQIRRARVRVKRSLRTNAIKTEASYLTTMVDVHEACACQCRVKAEDCDFRKGHVFREDLCSCECRDKVGPFSCSRSPGKYWDPSDCTCKCRNQAQCSTGLAFNTESCSCEDYVWN
ncbi:hypothetical protein HDE_04174 [Halotydeus destructor]|nr:hypothetical protein HDE_04174 [Halotydeus destructor]